MSRDPDELLNLKQFCKATGLDPRTVKKIAVALGGKRVGRLWIFRWGTAMEFFSNANTDEKVRQSMARASLCEREAGCQQTVPERKKGRPGMAGCKTMGGGRKTETLGRGDDPFGLREALTVGRIVP